MPPTPTLLANRHPSRHPISIDVVHSDSYGEYKTSMIPAEAFSKAAFDLMDLETNEATSARSSEGYRFSVVARVSDFIDASLKLDELEYMRSHGSISKDKYQESRKELIPRTINFNHAIKELIDNDPNATLSEVQNLIVSSYHAAHYQDLRDNPASRNEMHNYVTKTAETTLNGIRHELAINFMLSSLYEVRGEVSPEEDSKGIDLVILGRDAVPDIGIDCKASKARAESAREERYNYDRIILYSGASYEDFGDKLRISGNVADRLRPALLEQLEAEAKRTKMQLPSTFVETSS